MTNFYMKKFLLSIIMLLCLTTKGFSMGVSFNGVPLNYEAKQRAEYLERQTTIRNGIIITAITITLYGTIIAGCYYSLKYSNTN